MYKNQRGTKQNKHKEKLVKEILWVGERPIIKSVKKGYTREFGKGIWITLTSQ